MKVSTPIHPRGGFALLEVMLALFVFAYVGTNLAGAMHSIGKVSTSIRKEMVLTRVMDSELRRLMSLPQMEEGSDSVALDEGRIDIYWEITPIEGLENEKGQLLQEMYRIVVTATWNDGLGVKEDSVETWRYARLYQP